MIETKYYKTGKTHTYVISAMVRVGEHAEGFNSCQYYPSDYEGLEVNVRNGKVVETHRRAKSNLIHVPVGCESECVDLPEYVKQDPKVEAWLTRCQEELRQSCYAIAQSLMETQEEVAITLVEKGDEWTVTAKPAECWLEWGAGKVWWTPIGGAGRRPRWAEALRGQWDSAWR